MRTGKEKFKKKLKTSTDFSKDKEDLAVFHLINLLRKKKQNKQTENGLTIKNAAMIISTKKLRICSF